MGHMDKPQILQKNIQMYEALCPLMSEWYLAILWQCSLVRVTEFSSHPLEPWQRRSLKMPEETGVNVQCSRAKAQGAQTQARRQWESERWQEREKENECKVQMHKEDQKRA